MVRFVNPLLNKNQIIFTKICIKKKKYKFSLLFFA